MNINIKKLSGKWAGFYRIRAGRLRIIVEFQFERISRKLTGAATHTNNISDLILNKLRGSDSSVKIFIATTEIFDRALETVRHYAPQASIMHHV